MFNLSTQDVVQSIKKAPLVNLNGIFYQEYHDFFGKSMLDQLTNLENFDYTHLERQEHTQRQKISYHGEIIKRLKIFFMHTSITDALESKFKTTLSFTSVDIWRDGVGYKLLPHTDDHSIKLALQIYLGDNNVGTSLYDSKDNIIKSFEYRTNSGYALLNTKLSRHGTTADVTHGNRISIYVRYR
jgi:hypothetical protein